MVVRLDLHELVELVLLERIAVVLRVDGENVRLEARDDRRVVLVGGKRILRTLLVGVLDHPEERILLLLPVDDELRAEDLVAAVLGVDLSEHDELGVGRVASRLLEALGEIFHLRLGNRKADIDVRLADRLDALRQDVIGAARPRIVHVKEVVDLPVDALRHLVIQRRRPLRRSERRHLLGILRPVFIRRLIRP